ncbi:MAG: hypothetical protein Q7T15_09310 [Microcella sp.]|uniref:hypothetical protein n=1 Tax=Microcella sp. TaxID=1913979 RepID=UPI002719BAD0|nr:hypothetical protein [Microcella sp.]MDO8338435.1 hypothetical protein [Microcella sp.]
MTDPTPEDIARDDERIQAMLRVQELERQIAQHEHHQTRLLEMLQASAGDSASLLIVHPGSRDFLTALAAEDLAPVALEILRWMDELLLNPANDELRFDIELRAQVALATMPGGLADLE